MRVISLIDYCVPDDILYSRIVLAWARCGLLSLKIFAPLRSVRAFGSHYEGHVAWLLDNDEEVVRATQFIARSRQEIVQSRQEIVQATQEHTHNKQELTHIEQLLEDKDRATTLYEYEQITNELDERQGHQAWKVSRASIEPDYNPEVIEAQIANIKEAIHSNHPDHLSLVLRSSLSRHLGGMDNIRLYKHSWFGTKQLVDDYNFIVVKAINAFVNTAFAPGTTTQDVEQRRKTLLDASMMYGRTALSLSGGALLGMKHIGVAKCLWECKLLPDIISGTSAGSIVAAIIATRTDAEMGKTLQYFPESNLGVFDARDASPGIIPWSYRRLATLWNCGTFFDPIYLRDVLREWLGEITFQEAYNKTRRILNITVSKASSAEPTLLNHKTAPNVLIWSAVCASCAVPLRVFPAASIYEKVPYSKNATVWHEHAQAKAAFTYVDGSLDHDIPTRMLRELFNVTWLIVAQTNPHVRPFLRSEEEFTGEQPQSSEPHVGYLESLKAFAHAVALHTAQTLANLHLPPVTWRWGAMLTQQYTGNINIFPGYSIWQGCTMVANPSPGYMMQAMIDGERATWPKICRIKNAVCIELALERGIRILTERMHFPNHDRAGAEILQSQQRGRLFRGSSAQPRFLRSRSVGFDEERHRKPIRRRSKSGGRLDKRCIQPKGSGALSLPYASMSRTIPILAPQSGVNEWSLMMTPLRPRDHDNVAGN